MNVLSSSQRYDVVAQSVASALYGTAVPGSKPIELYIFCLFLLHPEYAFKALLLTFPRLGSSGIRLS